MGEARRRRLASGGKNRVTMFLDRDIVRAFRAGGAGYQTRINDALREYLLLRPAVPRPEALIGQAIRCLTEAKATLEPVAERKRGSTHATRRKRSSRPRTR